MSTRDVSLRVLAWCAAALVARAQNTIPEVEPNGTKAEAAANGTITWVAGDRLVGVTTGSSTAPGSTASATADAFRLRTGPLPLGVYEHSITLTTIGAAGHVGTLRGLAQLAGVIDTASDVNVQTSTTSSTPPRTNVWYGFGKQEEIVYRVTGTTATTAPYDATLATVPVVPTPIPGAFQAGAITIASAVGQTTDTEIYLYDANLDPVPDGHNDDPVAWGGLGPSRLTLTLPAGTYFVAIANFNTANDRSDACANEYQLGRNLLEFPDALVNGSSATNVPVSFTVTDGVTTTPVTAIRADPFRVVWGTFGVNGPLASPANDACSAPLPLPGPGTHVVSTLHATTGAEGQAEPACLAFGTPAIANDVWFTYVPVANARVTVATCGATPASANADSKIAVYADGGCPVPGSAIACNDDDCTASTTGLESRVSFTAVCGTTYTIQLGLYGGSLATDAYVGGLDVSETGGYPCETPVTVACLGDGSGSTACPCTNVGATGHGCANALDANGARLAASGAASVGSDTWRLTATGLPNGPGLYVQGTLALNGGQGVVFGDGLRCVGGTLVRVGIVTGVASTSSYPSPNPPAVNAIPISLRGLVAPGDARTYQLWYRDSAPFCSPAVFNLTNAVGVTWTP